MVSSVPEEATRLTGAQDLGRIHPESLNLLHGLLPQFFLHFLASGRCDELILPGFPRSLSVGIALPLAEL